MTFHSKNMHYVFNVEYFNDINYDAVIYSKDIKYAEERKKLKKLFDQRNLEIEDFQFPSYSLKSKLQSVDNYCSVMLYTSYPGLLIGIGNMHDFKVDGAIKAGFSFDYVTGLPYISGSSLKGMLRSCFPKNDSKKEYTKEMYIRYYLNCSKEFDVDALKDNIFNYNDVFIGAFPIVKDKDRSILSLEYITPHKNEFSNPNPISFIKIKPDICYEFSFILHDYVVNDEIVITKEEKCQLFVNLLLDMGIGAKTNVGFGRLSKTQLAPYTEEERNSKISRRQSNKNEIGKGAHKASNNNWKNNKSSKYRGY